MALWARYLLNGDGNDSSGNGRHLTVTNASYVNDRVTGSKSAFFGNTISTNMYATYAGSPGGAVGTAFSATCWVKYTEVQGLTTGGYTARGPLIFGGSLTTNAAWYWVAFEPFYNNAIYFTSPGRSGVVSTHTWKLNQWTMVGFIYNGAYSASGVTFVQDGRILPTGVLEGGWNPFPLNNNIIIGRVFYDATHTHIYTGLLQDVQLYSHALTASEVKGIYEKSFTENKILSGSMI